MFISFFTGKVMLFYGISLIMKEKSNASALPTAASSITNGREQRYRRPRVDNQEWGLARLLIGTEKESVPPKHTDVFGGTPNL